MEINDWYTVPLDVIHTIQTTQKKKKFSLLFTNKAPIHSACYSKIVTHPFCHTHKKNPNLDTSCNQSCSKRLLNILQKYANNFYPTFFHHYVHRTKISLLHNFSWKSKFKVENFL